MSSARPVRIGLVGCGRLAELGYLPALASLDGVVLAAVADPNPQRRARIAELAAGHPIQLTDAEEIAGAEAVDAAIIASPVAQHLADASALAAAGVPCLVEKPPASDLAGAEELARLLPQPWIGFNRRFTHGARLIDSVASEGPIELALELRYRRASWNAVGVSDPVVLDLAPHLVDLALLLSGSPEAGIRSARLNHERAELELETGRGSARISCAADRLHRERIVVRAPGRRPAISGEGGPRGLIASRLPGREHPLVVSLRAQLTAFAGAIRGADPGLLANAQDGVGAMRVIDAAREHAA